MAVKIRPSFSTFEIIYAMPITVQKNSFAKNSALRVQIPELRETIDFTALPAFNLYDLKKWEQTLGHFFSQNEISLEEISLTNPYFNMIKNPTSQYEGELLFIIESVLFMIIEKYSPISLPAIKKRSIKINGLSTAAMTSSEDIPEVLKIKIRPTNENLEETKKIIQNFLFKKPMIKFRLDGNCSFDLNELIFFVKELESFCGPNFFQSVEYLEEPLKNQHDYSSFHELHPYPEALDESLLKHLNNLDYFKKLPEKTHLVLKPSLIGISKSFELMKIASHHKKNIVISSSYETKSAIRPLLFLAANNPSTYHGLDTLKFLPKELSIEIKNSRLTF
jgi:hypothetical protein